jgi:hypothetical protein
MSTRPNRPRLYRFGDGADGQGTGECGVAVMAIALIATHDNKRAVASAVCMLRPVL